MCTEILAIFTAGKQLQCFQTKPVIHLQCLGAAAYRAEILIQSWWLGLARVKVNLKGLNHTELCPVNNQLNFSSLQFKME